MERWWKIVLLISIIGWLAACKPPELEVTAVPPTRTLAPTMTMTATAVPPSPTPTALPTLVPTETGTAVPTQTATAVPTVTPIPLPTTSFWDSALGDTQTGFQVVDQLGGRINTVTVQDDIAYVGVGPRLWLLDVSQPETPVEVGQSDILPGLIQYIAVLNDTAYVLTDDESGFWIVDVSQPHQPQLVDFFETDVPIYFLREWNGHLYVAPSARTEDKLIFRVDDPLQPIQIGELPYNYYPLANDEYVATTKDRDESHITVLVADATDLNNLIPVTEITANLNSYFIGTDQDQYYFLGIDSMPTIWVMPKQDSTNTPTMLDIELSPFFQGIHIEDQIIYVQENFGDAGSYGSNIEAFDVSANTARPLGRLSAGNESYGLFVDNGIIYVATGESLIIAGVSEERGLRKLSEWRSIGTVGWISTNNDKLFALNSWDDHIFQFGLDSTPPMHLRYEHKLDQMRIDEVALAGDVMFTAGWFEGIHRYQTDTTPWQQTAVFDSPNRIETVSGMIIQGNHLYAITDGVLTVLDISDPLQLPQVGKFEQLATSYSSLTVDDEQLFIWARFRNGHGFQVISIANPTMPEEIGVWQDPLQAQVNDLVVRDNLVYLLTPSLLRIIDVTDVANMTVIATLPIAGGATNLTLLDDKLLLGGERIRLVDISNPTQPHLIGELATPGDALDAVEYNGLIYVADGAGGLLVLRPLE